MCSGSWRHWFVGIGIAFAELVAFMEEMNNDDDTALVFKLIDITELYRVRVKQLCLTAETHIQSTGLNKRPFSGKKHTSMF